MFPGKQIDKKALRLSFCTLVTIWSSECKAQNQLVGEDKKNAVLSLFHNRCDDEGVQDKSAESNASLS